jgi:hypothetical protein
MKPIEAIKEIPKNIPIFTALLAIIKEYISLKATIQNQPQYSYLRAKLIFHPFACMAFSISFRICFLLFSFAGAAKTANGSSELVSIAR